MASNEIKKKLTFHLINIVKACKFPNMSNFYFLGEAIKGNHVIQADINFLIHIKNETI